ncbi:MAG: S-layer homology domain-containing protein [Syntrophomonas sp.]|nr:S-layer homology domain-containing protein [Syntrophomonas sp.]
MQLILGFKRNGKAGLALLVIFIFMLGLGSMAQPDAALAKTEFSDPAESLIVTLNDNGVAFELATYTISELESMPQVQREYSSIDRMPAPVFTAGEGIDLEGLLTSLGIDIDSITHFRFYANDDLVKKLNRNMLLDRTGYYFPNIVECWDSYWDEDANRYTDVEAASEGAIPVKPMLAITSSQGRWLESPDWSSLDDSTCLRLCLGQATPEECITMHFVRWVYKIEVFGKLESGGSSSVDPRVRLSTPSAGQTYQVGDTVEIEGTVEQLSSITLTITDPDGHLVYTVFDLDTMDGDFSEEFNLGPDAVPGTYTIEAGPSAGSSLGCTETFRVTAASASAADITLNTPPAGQTVQAGDKVKISGSAAGLTTAQLEVIGPAQEAVYSCTLNISISGDFNEEFTLGVDALPGDYTIQISAPGLKQNYTRVFKVASPGAAVPTSSLKDIANHWAADRINSLVACGAIKGYPDGTFQPDATITRAEFTTVVVKAFKLNNPPGKSFTDTSGHWAQDYIATATAAGIIGGYNDNTFGPNDPVTREQMAAIAVKAAQLTPVAGQNQFTDSSSIAAWARDAVAAAVNNQIIRGYPDNTFKPGGKATRAEAVTVIVNALNLK